MFLTEPFTIAEIFYKFDLMPCCGKPVSFYKGPRGGECTNIKCAQCGQKFNTNPMTHYFVKI